MIITICLEHEAMKYKVEYPYPNSCLNFDSKPPSFSPFDESARTRPEAADKASVWLTPDLYYFCFTSFPIRHRPRSDDLPTLHHIMNQSYKIDFG